MTISNELLTLFTGRIESRDGSYVIEVPASELTLGDLSTGQSYRVAILETPKTTNTTAKPDSHPTRGPTKKGPSDQPDRPVLEGDILEVEIADRGDQGDGIARVCQGFVIFVPGAEPGDSPTIRVTNVADTYAFGEIVPSGNTPNRTVQTSG